jgi:hypothetical protein
MNDLKMWTNHNKGREREIYIYICMYKYTLACLKSYYGLHEVDNNSQQRHATERDTHIHRYEIHKRDPNRETKQPMSKAR